MVDPHIPTKMFSSIGPPLGLYGNPRPFSVPRPARHHHDIRFGTLLAPAAPVPPYTNLYLTMLMIHLMLPTNMPQKKYNKQIGWEC